MLRFDFGSGRVPIVVLKRPAPACFGRYVGLADLCRFIGADYGRQLAALRHGFVSSTATDARGTVLLELRAVPSWLLALDREQVAVEHLEDYALWCRRYVDSDPDLLSAEYILRALRAKNPEHWE